MGCCRMTRTQRVMDWRHGVVTGCHTTKTRHVIGRRRGVVTVPHVPVRPSPRSAISSLPPVFVAARDCHEAFRGGRDGGGKGRDKIVGGVFDAEVHVRVIAAMWDITTSEGIMV
eukprot:CAMPEP_0172522278 /NCGR_PEP_ID=MMETSP1066-20121228/293039_1 /TAXON_ID=671091 /ORGANISM="Coscinodiscus wailesii, Strain CCMP2513" /LENGTH=113 /DNA_ID=CAMNT_0013305265 /DNA_START=277 /DNA_END=618 /DNA_ORIENTATION=-